MKRRDILKGTAVAAAGSFISFRASASKQEPKMVQTLTSETYDGKTGRMKVELHVYPKQGPCCERDHDKDGNCDIHRGGKFKERFQELVEDWERRSWEHFRPIEAVFYEPLMEDGEPWLVHEAWKPVSKDNLSTLFTPCEEIFRNHRWDLIERAVNLREHGYWKQEYGPRWSAYQAHPNGLDGGGCSPAYSHLKMFRRVTRKRLHKVVVRFEAVHLGDLRRFLGATAPEYARLEDDLEALEALRVKGKLTPRAYYQCRQERLERLKQLEELALRA